MIVHDGKEYARVTDILKPFSNYSHIDPEVLSAKASIGTEVHMAIEQDISGQIPHILSDQNFVSFHRIWRYFQSFLKWKEAIKPVFHHSEMRLYCDDLMISGQIDSLVEIQGEKDVILVDFKTAATHSPVSWPMQAHLYHYLLTKNKIDVSDRFLFLKLDKEGKYPIVFEYKFDMNIRAKCLIAVKNFWDNREKDSDLFSL